MTILDKTRAKQVILEIVRQSRGQLTGKTRLYKAFYLAHLIYARLAPDYMTEWPIVRMPNGPGIDSGDELLLELIAAGVMKREVVHEGPYPTNQYSLTNKQLSGTPLSAVATQAIQKAVEFVQTKTAAEISELTHEYSRSWLSASNGQPLNVYIDVIPDDEFERRQRQLDRLSDELTAAWN